MVVGYTRDAFFLVWGHVDEIVDDILNYHTKDSCGSGVTILIN